MKIKEWIYPIDQYREKVSSALNCIVQVYEFYLDGQRIEGFDIHFIKHPNQGEKGFLIIVEIMALSKGKHELEVRNWEPLNPNDFPTNELEEYEMES